MIKPSIDRIDSDGHYTFENIQFIEWKEHKLKPQGRMGKATPFRGVSFDKSRKRWRVQLKRHQKMYTGGRFKKLEDAIEASKNLWIKISKN